MLLREQKHRQTNINETKFNYLFNILKKIPEARNNVFIIKIKTLLRASGILIRTSWKLSLIL